MHEEKLDTTASGKGDGQGPVPIFVLQGKGYVWSADDAVWLRESCGIIGAMVGGVAAFKQQNAIHGLPLELCAEEVSLLKEKGWGTLMPPTPSMLLAWQKTTGQVQRHRKRPWDYDSEYDSDEYFGSTSEEEDREKQDSSAKLAWQTALAKGSHFEIPLVADNVRIDEQNSIQNNENKLSCSVEGIENNGKETLETSSEGVDWKFPSTVEERHRYIVFRDLHRRGLRLTAGSKFGADYLIYPGDPSIYHAQFCVRLWSSDKPLLPALFASACRGSFQARKHLLIASLEKQESEMNPSKEDGYMSEDVKVLYTTAGPIDGFG